jgi:hypothetical protein
VVSAEMIRHWHVFAGKSDADCFEFASKNRAPNFRPDKKGRVFFSVWVATKQRSEGSRRGEFARSAEGALPALHGVTARASFG